MISKKKNFFLFVIFALFTIFLAVWWIISQGQKKWTVVIYMAADNNLVNYSELDLVEISSLGEIKDFNLLLQVNRNGSSSCPNELWKGSHRFQLHKNGNNLCPSAGKLVDSTGKNNDRLFYEFIDYAMTEYPKDKNRHLVIYWNHGNKWMLPDNYNIMKNFVGRSVLNKHSKKDSVLEIFYNDYLNDIEVAGKCDSPKNGTESYSFVQERLNYTEFIGELSRSSFLSSYFTNIESGNEASLGNQSINPETFAKAFGNNEVEIISFDACLLGTIEMAYAMKEKAKIMVASEETISACGYNYSEILQLIKRNPDVNPEELSIDIVNSYDRQYNALPNYSLSTVNLTKLDIINQRLDIIALKLLQELNDGNSEFLSKIELSRKDCSSYGWDKFDVGSIDLQCFLKNLSKNLSTSMKQKELTNIINELTRLIQKEFVILEKSKDENKNSSGIAIYFPEFSKKTRHPIPFVYRENHPSDSRKLEFVKNNRWDNFLLTYKKLIENK